MKSKLRLRVSLSLLLFCCFRAQQAGAQCTNRYLDTIFPAIDSLTNVSYTTTAGGGNTIELMDIYQPAGDSACLRHLVIFAHGGAFFEGTKNDGDVEFLCHRFAQRGYVAVSINYRLASSLVLLYDSSQIFKYIMEASSDFKAAIRFFYKDASLTNQWNIDTNSVFIGGSSAGAIAADFIATVDSLGELAPAFQTVATANGGINGNSGNAGYSDKVIAVASLAGAVNELSWIKPSTPPMVLCQGTADGTIPYDCDIALRQYTLGLYPTIRFCGSGEMAPRLDSVGVNYSLRPFPGSGHVPWDTNVLIENQMDSAVAAFFYQVKCTQPTGSCHGPNAVATLINEPNLNIYPNPANNILHITLTDANQLSELRLYDCTGRLVLQKYAGGNQTTLAVDGLAQGVYLLRVYLQGEGKEAIVRRVVIE